MVEPLEEPVGRESQQYQLQTKRAGHFRREGRRFHPQKRYFLPLPK